MNNPHAILGIIDSARELLDADDAAKNIHSCAEEVGRRGIAFRSLREAVEQYDKKRQSLEPSFCSMVDCVLSDLENRIDSRPELEDDTSRTGRRLLLKEWLRFMAAEIKRQKIARPTPQVNLELLGKQKDTMSNAGWTKGEYNVVYQCLRCGHRFVGKMLVTTEGDDPSDGYPCGMTKQQVQQMIAGGRLCDLIGEHGPRPAVHNCGDTCFGIGTMIGAEYVHNKEVRGA
jgi:hypothetical protein